MTVMWNIGDHPAPDQAAIAEGAFIPPDRAGIDQIIFDPLATGGFMPFDDSGADADQSSMTDHPHRFLLVIERLDNALDAVVAAELIRSPTAWYANSIIPLGIYFVESDISGDLQTMFPFVDFSGFWAGDCYSIAFLAQTHHRNPDLQVFKAIGNQVNYFYTYELHSYLRKKVIRPGVIPEDGIT